jgi:hypothetical protein
VAGSIRQGCWAKLWSPPEQVLIADDPYWALELGRDLKGGTFLHHPSQHDGTVSPGCNQSNTGGLSTLHNQQNHL